MEGSQYHGHKRVYQITTNEMEQRLEFEGNLTAKKSNEYLVASLKDLHAKLATLLHELFIERDV